MDHEEIFCQFRKTNTKLLFVKQLQNDKWCKKVCFAWSLDLLQVATTQLKSEQYSIY